MISLSTAAFCPPLLLAAAILLPSAEPLGPPTAATTPLFVVVRGDGRRRAEAAASSSSSPRRRRNGVGDFMLPTPPTPLLAGWSRSLSALVYNPDGSVENTDDDRLRGGASGPPGGGVIPTIASGDGFDPVFARDGAYDEIASRLSIERAASLVRIAVANAPPSLGLSMDNVREARVITLDGSKMSIEAVVVSDDEGTCAATLVTVDLPRPFDVTKSEWLVEGFAGENVDLLDDQAKDKMKRMKEGTMSSMGSFIEGIEDVDGMLRELYGEVASFPEWWVASAEASADIVDECANIRELLGGGEDFRSEVEAMARYGLGLIEAEKENDDEVVTLASASSLRILRAHVAAVGPAGLILKVLTTKSSLDDDASDGEKKKKKKVNVPASVVEVPVPFDEVVREAGGVGAALDSVFAAADRAAAKMAEEKARAKAEVKAEAEAKAEVEAKAKAETKSKVAAAESAEAKAKVTAEVKTDVKSKISSEAKEEALLLAERKRQPKSPEEEAQLAAHYASMSSVEDRAFAILLDLGMIRLTPDPDDSEYDASEDDELAPENVWLSDVPSEVKEVVVG